jgi:hypothetical protein
VPLVSEDPRIVWIRAHCKAQGSQEGGKTAASTELYACGGG